MRCLSSARVALDKGGRGAKNDFVPKMDQSSRPHRPLPLWFKAGRRSADAGILIWWPAEMLFDGRELPL